MSLTTSIRTALLPLVIGTPTSYTLGFSKSWPSAQEGSGVIIGVVALNGVCAALPSARGVTVHEFRPDPPQQQARPAHSAASRNEPGPALSARRIQPPVQSLPRIAQPLQASGAGGGWQQF